MPGFTIPYPGVKGFPTGRVAGRSSAGTGALEALTVGSGLSLSAGTLVASAPDLSSAAILAPTTSTRNVIQPSGGTSVIPFSIKAIASQVAASLIMTDSSGNVLAQFTAAGLLQFPVSGSTLTLNPGSGAMTIGQANSTAIASNNSLRLVCGPSDVVRIENGGLGGAGTDTPGFGFTAASIGSPDAFVTRSGPGGVQQGNKDAAAPVSQISRVQSVVAGTNNTAGVDWVEVNSLGTGNARPGAKRFQGGAISATTGSAQQTAVDRLDLGCAKVLTNNTAVAICNCTLANSTVIAGEVSYAIEVTDGTDYQYETGRIAFGATNKAGSIANNACTKSSNQQAATSGTLAVTFALSAANPAVLSVNANSSLIPSTGYPRVTFAIQNLTQQAIALQ